MVYLIFQNLSAFKPASIWHLVANIWQLVAKELAINWDNCVPNSVFFEISTFFLLCEPWVLKGPAGF